MRNLRQWTLGAIVVMLLFVLAASASAQEEEKKPEAPRVAAAYKIDFMLHEVEGGKRVNTREYSMLLRDARRGSIRIGTRVPISLGEGKGVQYMDVGFNLDCSLRPAGSALEFEYNVEVSSLVTPDGSPHTTAVTPVLRSFRSGSVTLVTLGKPMLVSVVDELTTKRQLQIEATITKVQ